jgi:hypothetical protein
MKHMTTIEVPAETREILDFVKCDLCGSKIKHREYTVDEVEVCHKAGERYPEGGSITKTMVDMCGKCFDDKLIPWLRSLNVEPRTEEFDF